MTERCYYSGDSLTECEAKVLECRQTEQGYEALLDRTVIFPEGGGQLSDSGFIDGAAVLHAREDGEYIWHLTDRPVEAGSIVTVRVNSKERLDHSQQHTGEHILSGLAKKLYGASNVGFHMAKDYVTIDLDKFLGQDELEDLERAANRAVQSGIPVTCRTVTEQELPEIPLRKRAEGLKGPIRIVTIGDVDSCTCCGTHCEISSRVGSVRITASVRYKGGVRLWFVCGMRAVEDGIQKQRITDALAKRFSVKTEDLPEAVLRREQELEEARRELRDMTQRVIRYTAKDVIDKAPEAGGIRIAFSVTPEFSQAELKLLSEELLRNGKCIALLFGTKGETISYCAASSEGTGVSMRTVCSEVNAALNGKGGGKEAFCQGSAPKAEGYEEKLCRLEDHIRSLIK
jgi:alanyl-tRNA synthetase